MTSIDIRVVTTAFRDRAALAVAAARVAVEADWRRLTDAAAVRLALAERLAGELDVGSR